MNRHFWLGIAILITCMVGDYISTEVALSMGIHELNPVVSTFGLAPIKLFGMGALSLTYWYLYTHVPNFHKSPYAVLILSFWAAPLFNNLFYILGDLFNV